jgi:hypothetical protein
VLTMPPLASLCVYTIKHSRDLVPTPKATFPEKRRWRTAKRILDQARRAKETIAVVFAEAERTDNLVAWAVLTEVEITQNGTNYTVTNLKRLPEPHRAKSDLRKRDGKRLSANYIRPYAICRTPEFLLINSL